MLTIWGRRSSLNVQKVMWLVDELALEHERIDIGGSFGGLDTPEFLAMNPRGRIPVVQDGETTIWESHSILRYLAACYGGAQFWPESPAARSQADRWMDWTQTALQYSFHNGIFWGFYRTPAEKRNWKVINAALAESARDFGLLEKQLDGRRFLLGNALTLADIPAGTMLYRYFELEIERPSLPNVERWYDALKERPAYRAHVMLPFGELAGRTTS